MSYLSVQIESGEQLPPYCVVCGSEATDSCMVSCPAMVDQSDRVADAVTWGTFLFGLFVGWIVYFQSPRQNRLKTQWLTLPTCHRHSVGSEVLSVVEIQAVNHRAVRLIGVSDAFRREIVKVQSGRPASNVEAMAQFDAPDEDPNGFLGDLTKESLPDTGEYLRGLEDR